MFLLLFTILTLIFEYNSLAQKFNYDYYWQKFDTLYENGLFQSSLKILDTIYLIAKSENNEIQKIKSICKKLENLKHIDENIENSFHIFLLSELKNTNLPYKNIYYSLIGELFTNYLRKNFYKISKITQTTPKPEDIQLWSTADFLEESSKYFILSLENPNKLATYNILDFSELVKIDENELLLFTNLYDLLAYRTINFFTHNKKHFPKHIDQFKINKPDFFSDYKKFINIKLDNTIDTLNPDLIITKIYQNILKIHLEKNEISSLILWDLHRLKFMLENSVLPNKNYLFEKYLINLLNENENNPISQAIAYVLVKHYLNQKDNKFQAKVYSLIKKFIDKFPNGPYINNLTNILNSLNEQYISLTTEKYLPPNQNFPILISYKNIKKIKLAVCSLSFKNFLKLSTEHYSYKVLQKIFENSKIIIDTFINLPEFKDFLTHTTELIIPSLENGTYFILCSSTNSFLDTSACYAYTYLHVTNLLALKTQSYADSIYRFIILDRTFGYPIEKAKLHLFKHFYDANKKPILVKTFTSNKNGYIEINPKKENISVSFDSYFKILFTYKKDTLIIDEYLYPTYNQVTYKNNNKILLFTDRSIYRPGQTIHFKGILYNEETKNILPNQPIKLIIKNQFQQELDTLNFQTNKFGSFSGNYVIPNDIILGNIYLYTDYGTTTCKVEEYKSPQFYLTLDTYSKNFKIYDTIFLKLTAKTYSDVPVQNAKVNYSVYLTPEIFPIFKIPYPIKPTPIKIKDDFTYTDKNGEALLNFIAFPDSFSLNKYLAFNYVVKVKVTDINNETELTQTTINIPLKPIIIQTNIKECFLTNENIEIKTLNSIKKPIKSNLNIKIYSLKSQKFKKNRLWQIPDTLIYEENYWYKYLPNYTYNKNFSPENFEINKLIFEQNFYEDSIFLIKLTNFSTGYYLIEINAQLDTQIIKEKINFLVINQKEKKIDIPNPLLLITDKDTILAGNKLKINLYSCIENAYLILSISEGQNTNFYYLNLQNYKTNLLEYQTKSNSEENIIINASLIYDNRIYNEKKIITKIDTFKFLKFIITAPKIVQPGDTVSLTINNLNKIESELIVCAYDKSLDAIYKNYWKTSFLLSYTKENYFYSQNMFSINPGFFINTKRLKYLQEIDIFNLKSNLITPNLFYLYQRYPTSKDIRYVFAKQKENIEIQSTKQKEDEIEDFSSDFIREDFRETAIFLPHIICDKKQININFSLPHSLTTWKLKLFAHSNDLKSFYNEQEIISQKKVTVQANIPSFFRTSDTTYIPIKITNSFNNELNLSLFIEVIDGIHNTLIAKNKKSIKINENESIVTYFKIFIPEEIPILKIKTYVIEKNLLDGEEKLIPVLPNKLELIESIPFYVNSNSLQTIDLSPYKNKISKTPKIIFEYCQNPIFYTILSIPYVLNNDIETNDQLFNKIFTLILVEKIFENNPELKMLLEKWNTDTMYNTLVSDLEKKQELKYVLLNNTIWQNKVAKDNAIKRNLINYFNKNLISKELENNIKKLIENQHINGGWGWHKKMNPNLYITLNITYNYFKIHKYFINKPLYNSMLLSLNYLNSEFNKIYQNIDINSKENWIPDYNTIIYLLIQTQLPYFEKNKKFEKEFQHFFYNQAKKFWNKYPTHIQALLCNLFYNLKDTNIVKQIIASIKEKAIHTKFNSVYWKDVTESNQTYLNNLSIIKVIDIYNSLKKFDNDKILLNKIINWIIQQKRTNSWDNVPEIASVIHVIFDHYKNFISSDFNTEIYLCNKKLNTDTITKEFKTTYFKIEIPLNMIDTNNFFLKINNNSNFQAWGAIYLIYLEEEKNIDKYYTEFIKIHKSYYKEINTKNGTILEEITNEKKINAGEIIVERITIEVKNNLNFVHIRNYFPSTCNYIEQLSGYVFNHKFSYYQEKKNTHTNYFIDILPKGKYILENKFKVLQSGYFNSGITTIQCYYAPDFNAHTQNKIIIVE